MFRRIQPRGNRTAIGIVSFAFVSIIGLLPAGMGIFRASMNTSISSQIVQRVLNEVQQTEFSELSGSASAQTLTYHELEWRGAANSTMRYFDEQGNELSAAAASKSLYHVHAVVQKLPKFPDTKGQNTIEMDELVTVVVQVAVNPAQRVLPKDGATLLWQPTPNITLTSYPVLVAHE
jgi:uncharacterized protein (TIGR02598 family)